MSYVHDMSDRAFYDLYKRLLTTLHFLVVKTGNTPIVEFLVAMRSKFDWPRTTTLEMNIIHMQNVLIAAGM